MMNEQFFFPSISSSLFDTYLVYGIIGLLILIAIIGLFVLLTASCCCCCYCCASPSSCNLCCYSNRRHSSYKLSKKFAHSEKFGNENSKRNAYIRRQTSDVADFSQLYDSCPHLINSKAMPTTSINMDTSCTTIDTFVSPVSPCSSFRSIIESGTLANENKLTTKAQNDLSNPTLQNNINIDKTNNILSSSVKDVCSRPFSYIKNINDRAQILRRFTQQERSIPPAAVPLDVTRISSTESDNNNQLNSTCTNIYETVLPPTHSNMNKISPSDISTPIYETEWTHNLRQLMMATTSPPIGNEGVSVIELSSVPPDLVPSTKKSIDYFQQQSPYDKFLANRSTTSDSMRRANMLRRLKDDAAFLY